MTTRLMNSAMMPAPGHYELHQITPEEFSQRLCEDLDAGVLRSYIGYPQTADLIKSMTGRTIDVNRDLTDVVDGDTLLIIKLNYRVADPKKKGQQVKEDFEFFVATYHSL